MDADHPKYRDNYVDAYKIEGAINIDGHPCFFDENSCPNFQLELQEFKDLLISQVKNNNEPKTFYKFGDGDYFFLQGQAFGSAEPGRRALSLSYSEIKHEEFKIGASLNDFYTCELYNLNRKHFKEVINKEINFPAEIVYGLVANKWLFKNFSGQIGLIGGCEKIELIQRLMEHKEYQEYLKLKKFEDYIYIPQKFACDDIDKTEKILAKQLETSTSKIFLVGIGHVKSALLHRMKSYKNAIYLDVGTGIDALAGVIDYGRPYFGAWINHQIKNYNYKGIDLLGYNWGGEINYISK